MVVSTIPGSPRTAHHKPQKRKFLASFHLDHSVASGGSFGWLTDIVRTTIFILIIDNKINVSTRSWEAGLGSLLRGDQPCPHLHLTPGLQS